MRVCLLKRAYGEFLRLRGLDSCGKTKAASQYGAVILRLRAGIHAMPPISTGCAVQRFRKRLPHITALVVIYIPAPSLVTPFHACSASPGTQRNAVIKSPFSTALDTSCFVVDHLGLIFDSRCVVMDGDDKAGVVFPIGTGGNGKNNGRGSTWRVTVILETGLDVRDAR
jgi:hypothetical protein